MIMIIHTERSHIIASFIGLALLMVMLGASYRIHKTDEEFADAVRNWHEVNRLEARVDKYEQVVEFYSRLKPVPLKGESRD